jgi:hypothetical protein
MRLLRTNLWAGGLLACAVFSGSAYGQCADPWVSQAVKQVKGSINGAGATGDCNIRNYGGGHWTTYNDLVTKVQAYFHPPAPSPVAGMCTDPWVTQAVRAVKGSVNGSGTAGDCNIANYGGGHWTSYADLQNKVQAFFHPPAPAPIPAPRPAPQQPFQTTITSPTQGAVLGEGATINVTWTYTGTPSPSQQQNGVQILLVESGAALERASLGSNLPLSAGRATVALPRNFVLNPGFNGVLCNVQIIDMTTQSVLAQTPSVSCNYAFAQ